MKSQIFTFARKIITHSILTSYLLMSIGQSYAMDPQLGLDTNGFKYRITGVEIIGRGYDLEESHDDPEICQPKEFESISDIKTSEGIYSSLGATPTNGWESVGGLPNSRNPKPTHGLFKALEMTPPRKHSSDKSFRSKTPENNSNRTTPQSMWEDPAQSEGVRSNAATPTYDSLRRLPPKFPYLPDVENI